jgi:hypothetical protein
MVQIMPTKLAGPIDEADHQRRSGLQYPARLDQHSYGIIHKAYCGHHKSEVKDRIFERQGHSCSLKPQNTSFGGVSKHRHRRVNTDLDPERSSKANGSYTDLKSQTLPWQ